MFIGLSPGTYKNIFSDSKNKEKRSYDEFKKCVMVIDEELPLGIIANTSAILGITLGKKYRS